MSWLWLLWVVPFLSLVRLARRTPDIRGFTPIPRGPTVSVIVPARNEADTIARVVGSVLSSTYAPLELVVLDDRSSDDTVARLAPFAADPRLRILRGRPLPPGWFGKPWACYQGSQAASGEILVFTDADTFHEPKVLEHAVAALEGSGAALLTLAPRQRSETFWERLIMPQVWFLLGVRYHPRVVNRARRRRDLIANGQFIMMRRRDYEAIGTHQAVRGEVAEDLALAQHTLAMGYRVYFAFAHTLMETRMYRDLAHLTEGWSKNIYQGARRSFPDEPWLRPIAPLLPAVAMLYWLIPPVLLLLLCLPNAPAGGATSALLAAALSAMFWAVLSGAMRIPPWYGVLYPLGAAMTLYIVLRSFVRGTRRIEWKGRVYGNGAGTRIDE